MLPFVLKTICEKEKKKIIKIVNVNKENQKRKKYWFNLLGSCYPPDVLIRLRGLFLPRIINIPSIDRGFARQTNYIHQKQCLIECVKK